MGQGQRDAMLALLVASHLEVYVDLLRVAAG